MGFYLYTGNKLEKLAEAYCRQIYDRPLPDPMAEEIVVVQTQGMAAYLKQFIAEKCGIAANLQMPFPNSFCEKLITRTLPGFAAAKEQFSGVALICNIYTILTDIPEKFPELAKYISDGSAAELRRWQLSAKLAELFDRYQIYRYDLHNSPFNSGSIQAKLWQELTRRHGQGKDHYFRTFLSSPEQVSGLPPRISIFGAGSLPPLYLNIFFKLSDFCEIHFFYLSPSQEYWGQIYSSAEKRFMAIPDAMPEAGNPLLASWGEAGRELFSLLLDHQDQHPYIEDELFEDFVPGTAGQEPTVLQLIQQDILTMNDSRSTPRQLEPDGSLEILNCHSPKREVEILHDKLLKEFTDSKISPREVIVMAPDINEYAPIIEAVFSSGPLKNCYTLSDRTLRNHSVAADLMVRLLQSHRHKMEAGEVFALLATPPASNAWQISASELSTIREWVEKCGIRWGADQEDRRKSCGVEFEEFAWFPALDRMLMHFSAGKSDDLKLIDGECPLAEHDLLLYGKLRTFLEELNQLRRTISEPHPAAEWLKIINGVIERFIAPGDSDGQREAASIRQFINDGLRTMIRSGLNSPVPVDIVLELLNGFLNIPGERFSFLRGKITFCSLTPLRSIPSRIIAILGLNHHAFPRRDHHAGFDLMAANVLRGDRSATREDRYLFLEALLSARRAMWLFYDGRSRQDTDKHFPSQLLGELADYLNYAFGIRETMHKMQPFDPEYFRKDSPFFSFSIPNYHAAAALLDPRQESDPTLPLAVLKECFTDPDSQNYSPEKLDIADIISIAKQPAKFFLSNLQDVRFREAESFDNDETFALSSLDKYKLRNKIFELLRCNKELKWCYNELLKANNLPPGSIGINCFNELYTEIDNIPTELRRAYYSREQAPVEFKVGDTTIHGMLEVTPDRERQIIISFSSYKYKSHVDAMLRHYAFAAAFGNHVSTELYCASSRGVRLEKKWDHRPDDIFWQTIISLYGAAINYPLPVFPKAIMAYAKAKDLLPEDLMSDIEEDLAQDIYLAKFFNRNIVTHRMFQPLLHEMCKFFELFPNDPDEL